MTAVNGTLQYLGLFNFDLCWMKLFKIEPFNYLTVCKQMTDNNDT